MRTERAAPPIAIALLTAAIGCGLGGNIGPSATGGGHSNTINIVAQSGSYGGGYTFAPTPDTVAVGSVVTWVFGSVQHNVTFTSQPDTVSNIAATMNTSVGRTPTKAGTYNYTCTIHNFSGVLVAK